MSRYSTVVVDPPWQYGDKLGPKNRGAERHYRVMHLDEITAIPVGKWAAPDAHLYVWATNAFVAHAFELVRRWGFRPITVLTWVKYRFDELGLPLGPRIGMGRYYRNNTEQVVFGVRGKLPALRHDVPTSFIAPRARHSEKPAEFYRIVESMSPGPYLDVFARQERAGWEVWGDEVTSTPLLVAPEARP